jgi:Protein of unknown function (DUF2905)
MNAGDSFQLGKMLLIFGLLMVVIGLLFMAFSKFPFFGFGRLPGDFAYKGKNISLYFPIVTCLLVSILLTLFFWVISFLRRK